MSRMFNHPHPGALVKATLLDATGLSVTAAAAHLGINRATLSKFINCHTSLSPEMAVRLSLALNTSTEMWLNLQRNYELWVIERLRKKLVNEVTRIGNTRRVAHSRMKRKQTTKKIK